MAWTAPRTWVAGEIVTAALLNTHARDNQKMLSDAWGAYTVTWTGVTTNPVIGNGTLAGVYMQIGSWIRFRISLIYGTSTNAGTGNSWFWTLPATPIVAKGPLGTAICFSTVLMPRIAFCTGTTVALADMTPTRVGPGVPFAWSSTHELHINGEYEAA